MCELLALVKKKRILLPNYSDKTIFYRIIKILRTKVDRKILPFYSSSNRQNKTSCDNDKRKGF